MLKLCGFAVSNYYNKVKIALMEKGVPFRRSTAWCRRSPPCSSARPWARSVPRSGRRPDPHGVAGHPGIPGGRLPGETAVSARPGRARAQPRADRAPGAGPGAAARRLYRRRVFGGVNVRRNEATGAQGTGEGRARLHETREILALGGRRGILPPPTVRRPCIFADLARHQDHVRADCFRRARGCREGLSENGQ